jgi:hypothetical protein
MHLGRVPRDESHEHQDHRHDEEHDDEIGLLRARRAAQPPDRDPAEYRRRKEAGREQAARHGSAGAIAQHHREDSRLAAQREHPERHQRERHARRHGHAIEVPDGLEPSTAIGVREQGHLRQREHDDGEHLRQRFARLHSMREQENRRPKQREVDGRGDGHAIRPPVAGCGHRIVEEDRVDTARLSHHGAEESHAPPPR